MKGSDGGNSNEGGEQTDDTTAGRWEGPRAAGNQLNLAWWVFFGAAADSGEAAGLETEAEGMPLLTALLRRSGVLLGGELGESGPPLGWYPFWISLAFELDLVISAFLGSVGQELHGTDLACGYRDAFRAGRSPIAVVIIIVEPLNDQVPFIRVRGGEGILARETGVFSADFQGNENPLLFSWFGELPVPGGGNRMNRKGSESPQGASNQILLNVQAQYKTEDCRPDKESRKEEKRRTLDLSGPGKTQYKGAVRG